MQPSNWTAATRLAHEAELTCTKCDAANRPGAFLLKYELNGTVSCGQCGTNFTPKETR